MTPKKAKFAVEYLKDGNATRAARSAGCPAKSAAVTAARWLKDPEIVALIGARMEKAGITADWILGELKKLGGYDIGKIYDKDGNLIPVHLLDADTRAAVASVDDETATQVVDETTEKNGTVTRRKLVTRKQRMKMADKVRPLELLGRYFKLFTDRVEHDGRMTLEQLVSGSSDRNERNAA